MRLLILSALLTASLSAQIQIFNQTDIVRNTATQKLNSNFSYLNNNKVGANQANTYGAFLQDFSNALIKLPLRLVSTLPSASSNTNREFVVTDGTTTSDCTAGGGSARVLCISTGASWIPLGGGGGGGSVFSGSVAVTSAFSATPTFSLADATFRSPVRFEPGAMTGNVTSVTFSNKPAQGGAKWSIVWLQDGTGSRTVSYGASASNTCTISPTLNKYTEQFFELAADGTTVYGTGCITNDPLDTPVRGPASSTVSDLVCWNATDGTVVKDCTALPNGTTATTQSALDNSTKVATTAYADGSLKAQYKTLSCQPGLGDGTNAIAAATYLESTCWNKTGVTFTITAIQCFTDNAGTSTLNATNGTGTGLLTGAVTCSSTIASGTQSGTTTIASNDFIKFTFVADGTSKQTTWVVAGTY